ncbi:MAG: pyrroline-5-carboxylate reductase [Candidatus Omnitrophica bacterium]|nr:pyrroline-5-carboxylate reductase [Candidatus Omnitrophota bacterium]
MPKKIGIIGFGNMGSAIAERIKSEYEVFVFEKDAAKTNDLTGIRIASSITQLLDQSQVIILAIKPQDFEAALAEIKDGVQDKLVISIAAGITTGYIEKILGQIRVVRAMPNLGAKIGKSVTCLTKGQFATKQDMDLARNIFSSVGVVDEFKEDMMNAATAISGSGPGYYFHAISQQPEEYKADEKKFHKEFIASLTEAARSVGFDNKAANFLASWTIVYSDLLLKQTKLPAEELARQVTSKGGTTEAALEILHKGGSLVDAVKAAVDRAKQLSRG